MDQLFMIDFARGWPAPSLLPAAQLSAASVSIFSSAETYEPGLNYGDDEGYLPLRQSLAEYLTNYYGARKQASVDRICITGGASQNIACVLQVFTDPIQTKAVWVVEPSYFLAIRIFEDSGFYGNKLQGVPADDEGIDLVYLENAIKTREAFVDHHEPNSPVKPSQPHRKIYRHVIYCSPTYSNPSGLTMSQSRRQELIRLARKHDALIICDDVYDFIQWSTNRHAQAETRPVDVTRIVDLDKNDDGNDLSHDSFGNCVSNGSFSKILGPGCRVGWAEASPRFIHGLSQAGSTRSGGAPSQLMSTIVNELFNNGSFDEHIKTALIPEYSRRFYSLITAIKEDLYPLGFSLDERLTSSEYAGGFFIWLRLPNDTDVNTLADKAEKMGVLVSRGPTAAVPRPIGSPLPFSSYMRLCFTFEEVERQREGIKRLAKICSVL